MAKRIKHVKPPQRRFLTAEVVARKEISPNFVRVTLGGPGLREFTAMGFDQWFRFFLPNESGVLRLPTKTNNLWFAQYMAMSKETRPIGRNYTVREHRADGVFSDGPELDIDFALHDDPGPATSWAASAAPGDKVGLSDEGITYLPPDDAAWQLFAGDETALPAIMAILRDAPRELRGDAFIEIRHADDAQQPDAPDGVTIHWLVRADSEPVGSAALRAITALERRDDPGYAFLAGAQALVTDIRRHLVTAWSVPKERVTFTGYWR